MSSRNQHVIKLVEELTKAGFVREGASKKEMSSLVRIALERAKLQLWSSANTNTMTRQLTHTLHMLNPPEPSSPNSGTSAVDAALGSSLDTVGLQPTTANHHV